MTKKFQHKNEKQTVHLLTMLTRRSVQFAESTQSVKWITRKNGEDKDKDTDTDTEVR